MSSARAKDSEAKGAIRPDCLAWAERLIRFDTTSRRSNLALIEDVRKYLDQLGISYRLTSGETGKSNLLATLPAANGARTGGILLSGHSDVVPVDGQTWSSPPFEPIIRDGKLFGRGACDMKGFLGTAIALLPTFREMRLAHPVHLALSYDEELGCLGAPHLIADLVDQGFAPKACIVGEPTMMAPVIAHKGANLFRCRVHGIPAHSSLPHLGVNAIEIAARIVDHIARSALARSRRSVSESGFDPPASTLTVCQIRGGVAPNVVPETCEFTFDLRNLPSDDPSVIEAEIQTFIDHKILGARAGLAPEDLRVELECVASVPALLAAQDAMLTNAATALTSRAAGKAAYCTEAGQFRAAGIPTIVCGPGSIDQAHKADEWVSLDQLVACEDFLKGIVALPNDWR